MKKLVLIVFLLSVGVLIANAYPITPIGGGGLQTSTIPLSGQLPIGNASGTYSINYLTAGTNVTITTSSGGILITGTGGGSITTSSAGIANQLTYWTSASAIAPTSTIFLTTSTNLGVANFATSSISQWVNDAGYVSSTTGISSSTIWNLFSNSAVGLTYSTSTGATTLTSGYFIPLNTSATSWNAAFASSSLITSALGTNAFNSTAFLTAAPATTSISAQGVVYTGPDFTFATSGPMLAITGGTKTITFTMSSSSLNLQNFITTSTYNASITIATAAPLTGGGSLSNGGTLSLSLTTPLTIAQGGTATNTTPSTNALMYFDGNFIRGTSSVFYLASNPTGYITTSTYNANFGTMANQAVPSAALVLSNGTAISAYGGAGACANAGMVSTISAVGGTTCISSSTQLSNLGISAGSNAFNSTAIPTNYYSTINGSTASGATTYNIYGGLGISVATGTASTTLSVNQAAALSFSALGNTTSTANISANSFKSVTTSTFAQGVSVGTTTNPTAAIIFNVVGAGTSTIKFGDASSSKPACFMMADYPAGTSWTYVTSNAGVISASTTPCN